MTIDMGDADPILGSTAVKLRRVGNAIYIMVEEKDVYAAMEVYERIRKEIIVKGRVHLTMTLQEDSWVS